MLETEADRLESIKALGGQLVQFDAVQVWAVFDDAGVPVEYGDVHVNSTSPRLTLRRSDVDANDLGQRGIAVVVNGVSYAVREHLPGDAPGWSILILSKP